MTRVTFKLTSLFLIILLSTAWTWTLPAAAQDNEQSNNSKFEKTGEDVTLRLEALGGFMYESPISPGSESHECELASNTQNTDTDLTVTITFNNAESGSGSVPLPEVGSFDFRVDGVNTSVSADVTTGNSVVFSGEYTAPQETSTVILVYVLAAPNGTMAQQYYGQVNISLVVAESSVLERNPNYKIKSESELRL